MRKKTPDYLRHRPSGQARVRVDGQDLYLGPYGSQESRDRYNDVKHIGTLRAREFSPKRLKAVREAMISAGLARTTINSNVNRIRRMSRHAAARTV